MVDFFSISFFAEVVSQHMLFFYCQETTFVKLLSSSSRILSSAWGVKFNVVVDIRIVLVVLWFFWCASIW